MRKILLILITLNFLNSVAFANDLDVNNVILADTTKKESKIEDKDFDTYNLLKLFGEVLKRAKEDYVEEVSDKKLIEAALNGMLSSLDPHSGYLTLKDWEDMQVTTKGEFGGLGIEVTMEGGLVKVISPIEDTPAFKAGVKPGDLIINIDGAPVFGLSLGEAVEKMRGKAGTDIKISIKREGQDVFDLKIKRDIIKITAVKSELKDGNVGYVRITSFSQNVGYMVSDAIKKINKESKGKVIGYILDLRSNPGGLLDEAVKVSDVFLEKGEIVSTRARKEKDTQRWSATAGDALNGLPLVVLINDGSASASEIVAGALKDHRRAVVVGTKSFGKGSVQTVIPMDKYGAIKITTQRYYTPSGTSIQGTGIEPDIEVKAGQYKEFTFERIGEAELKNALKNEQVNGKKDNKNGNDEEKENIITDYQLLRATDILKALALYGKTSNKK
ncbi:MAG: Carboxy-terminal processing protease CtpA precursor [Alphaproteobacteria bacterium ADurb.Bin438]|nr:MAG: Carboxy-terminal processing protease CtpA precursor [Alphaproteobacteria bacterium ADurb.Bin438]